MSKQRKKKPAGIRDRIKELRRVKASDIIRNPRNWRSHPDGQRAALRAVLGEIGYAGALLVRELAEGQVMLIDGELRADISEDQEVPVLVTDLSEAEADKLLALFDPVGDMAEIDQAALDELLSEIDTSSDDLADLLAELGSEAETSPVKLKQIDVKPPPKMTWVLVGIPTVSFGSIAEHVEQIAAIESAIVETTSNDG